MAKSGPIRDWDPPPRETWPYGYETFVGVFGGGKGLVSARGSGAKSILDRFSLIYSQNRLFALHLHYISYITTFARFRRKSPKINILIFQSCFNTKKKQLKFFKKSKNPFPADLKIYTAFPL